MEKRKEMSPVSLYVLGFIGGVGIMNGCHSMIIDSFQEDDKREQIVNAQLYNQQLETQLEQTQDDVDNLLIDYEDRSFSFEMEVEGQNVLVCVGDFDVTEGTARAVGDLACTELIPIEESN